MPLEDDIHADISISTTHTLTIQPFNYTPTKELPLPKFTLLSTFVPLAPSLPRYLNYHRTVSFFTYLQAPLEYDFKSRVEYDMDHQDRVFLTSARCCSMDVFEFLMDFLEKEWYELR